MRRLQGPGRASPLSARARRLAGVFGVAAGILVLDQATKIWAVAALSDGPIAVFGESVQFRLTRNSGAAFSSMRGATPLLAALAMVIVVVLVRMAARTSDRWMLLGLAMVLGGALGNLADRLFRAPGFLEGHVVDFVDVGSFPVFNVADSAITLGAVLLVARTLFARDPEATTAAEGSEAQT